MYEHSSRGCVSRRGSLGLTVLVSLISGGLDLSAAPAAPPQADLDEKAPVVSLDVLEPVEGGEVVFQRIAPNQINTSEQGRISIRLRISNGMAVPASVERIEILGEPVTTFAIPKEIVAGGSIVVQNCNCDESKALVIDAPFPKTALIKVILEGEYAPIERTVVIRPHTNDGGPLSFIGEASDLGVNQAWGASSDHGADHQVFALDTGVLGWNGDVWSEQFPGTDGTLREHWRIYGMPVYAMADGTVCWALNDHPEHITVPDKRPPPDREDDERAPPAPKPPGYNAGGNQIFVKSGDEISVIAHLQPGSIPPELLTSGAPVKRGQYLGKVGLSGDTGHPHTHIHVKKDPDFVAPEPSKFMNGCDQGAFRPMTFGGIASLTHAEGNLLAAQNQLDPDDWTALTDHSAPHPYGLLYPAPTNDSFCQACSQSSQYVGVWRTGDHIDLRVKVRGWTAFTEKWKELSNDTFRLVEIETFLEDGERQYLGLFQRGGGNHYLWNVAGWEGLTTKRDELAEKGLRLIDLDTYVSGGQRFFIGVFREGEDAHDLVTATGWDAFTKEWSQLGDDGLRLVDLETFAVGEDQREYVGVFRAGSDGHVLWSVTGWEPFTAKWKELGDDGLRLVDIESFPEGKDRQFLGVFRQGGGGYTLESHTGYDNFVQACERSNHQGLRLVDLHVEE